MIFKMEIFYSSSYYDISDYVIFCSNVPIISRNRNYEIDAKGFRMSVSENFNNTQLEGATRVRLTIDSTVKFFGYPTKITKNYNKHTYDFQVMSMLGKLKDYSVDTETLNALIIDTNQDYNYRGSDGGSTSTNDNYGYKNVAMLWLIKQMFEVASISCTVDLYGSSHVIVSNKYVYMPSTSHDPAVQDDFYLEDVRLDLNMFYSINQSYANNATKISSDDEGDYSYAKNKLNCFKLLQILCAMFSLDVYYNGTSYVFGYRSTADDEGYSTADDDTYSKTNEVFAIEEANYFLALQSAVRSAYQNTTADSLTTFYKYGDKGGVQISWLSNLVFLIQGKWSGVADGDVYPYALTAFGLGWNMFTPVDGIVGNRYEIEKTLTYTKKKIISPVETSFKNVVRNEIDIDKVSSTLTEVSY